MTSEATRKSDRDARRKEEDKRVAEQAAITLKEAQAVADARSEDDLVPLGHTAPLVREDENQFIQQEEYDGDPAELAPDLTKTGVAGLIVEPPATIIVKADDVEHTIPLTESRLEIMSDEDIADAGLLTEAPPLVHPARVAPTSERQRTPLQRAPAAGPGTWPVPEDQLPAVVPSDPPVEEGEVPGDASLAGYPPFKASGRKVVVVSSEGVHSEVAPDETKNAAALYLRLRNQFPHFTEAELSDEFIVQWESRVGADQSFRPGQELSQHGDTAVGDPRVTLVELGREREDASLAQPNSLPPEPSAANTPEAGLPSVNEPASRAQDDEKFGLDIEDSRQQDAADLEAMAKTKALREAEESGEPLPEPPPVVNPGAGGAEKAAEKSPPKPAPTQLPAEPAKKGK